MTHYFEVEVTVATPDYVYTKRLNDAVYRSRDEAFDAIEKEIQKWSKWDEGRKASFRSHCKVQEVDADFVPYDGFVDGADRPDDFDAARARFIEELSS